MDRIGPRRPGRRIGPRSIPPPHAAYARRPNSSARPERRPAAAPDRAVNPAQTSTFLTAIRAGNRIILTAQVGPVAPGGGSVAGAVTFYRANGKLQGTVPFSGSGASLTLKRSYALNKKFWAKFGGATNYGSSESARIPIVTTTMARTQAVSQASLAGRVASAAGAAASRLSSIAIGVLPSFTTKKAR